MEMNAAVAPLFLVVVVLQITLVGAPVLIFLQFVAGSTLVVLGMLLLFIGVDFGFLPMPRFHRSRVADEEIDDVDCCRRVRLGLCGNRGRAGCAKAGTVLFGRGAGINEQEKILGILIEPEKEIVLTIAYSDNADAILAEIVRAVELDQPRMGLAFVVSVDKVIGAAHFEDKKSR